MHEPSLFPAEPVQRKRVRHIVVGLHDTDSSRAALRWAILRSAACGARLTVVTAVIQPLPLVTPGMGMLYCTADGQELLHRMAHRQREWIESESGHLGVGAVETGKVVALGDPARVLSGQANEADLLVFGSRPGRRLLSVARRLRTIVDCPVVVVDVDGRPR